MKIYVVMHKEEPLYVSKYEMFANTWMESKFPSEEDRKDVEIRGFWDIPEKETEDPF